MFGRDYKNYHSRAFPADSTKVGNNLGNTAIHIDPIMGVSRMHPQNVMINRGNVMNHIAEKL